MLKLPPDEDKHELRIATLRTLVNKHQRIIAFADSVENVFCYMALMQFLSNTLVICFLGFLIVTVSKIRYTYALSEQHFAICPSDLILNRSRSIPTRC